LTVADMASRAMLLREAPELFESEQDLAKRLIKIAQAINDWEKLFLAIDFQIAQQAEFVVGWGEKVRPKGYQRNNDVRKLLPVSVMESRTGVKQPQVSLWKKWTGPDGIDAYRQRLRDTAYKEAGILPRSSHRTLGTGDNEWFTPPLFIEAARDVLGGEIDLDPASHPKAQKWIKAKDFYTREKNGLEKEWRGRVWLNPPYGRVEVALFIDKLIEHYQRGDVSAAVLLTHNYTDTRWFHAAVAASQMICFTRGRIEFEDNTGETCKPAQGQAFFYFGAAGARFIERFRPIGFVMSPAA
jgi:phage N-6-adenine-methyltransferase